MNGQRKLCSDTNLCTHFQSTILTSARLLFSLTDLESWVGVLEELLEVGLEPVTGFWGGLERIRETAVEIVSDG